MKNESIHATFLESNILSQVAWNAVNQSSKDPAQALVTILFGCACIESVLNEALYNLKAQKRLPRGYGPIAVLAQEAGLNDERVAIKKKLRVLGLGATGAALKFDRKPFKDMSLLLRLRNWVVHLQPEETVVNYRDIRGYTKLVAEVPHKLVLDLVRQRVIDSSTGPTGGSLVMAIQSESVARWSYRVTYDVLRAIGGWFPEWHLLVSHLKPKPGW